MAQDQVPLTPLVALEAPGAVPMSASSVGFEPETLAPEQARPFKVRRSPSGEPLGPPVNANIVDPSRVSEFML